MKHWRGCYDNANAPGGGNDLIYSFCLDLNDPIMTARLRVVGAKLIQRAVSRNRVARKHGRGRGETIYVAIDELNGTGILLVILDEGGPELFCDDDCYKLADTVRYDQAPGGMLSVATFYFQSDKGGEAA